MKETSRLIPKENEAHSVVRCYWSTCFPRRRASRSFIVYGRIAAFDIFTEFVISRRIVVL
jgi:hypothetical protein